MTSLAAAAFLLPQASLAPLLACIQPQESQELHPNHLEEVEVGTQAEIRVYWPSRPGFLPGTSLGTSH